MDICDILSFRGTLILWLVFLAQQYCALEEQPLQLLPNGGFSFGYANRDRGASYHEARGTPDKIVRGRFGSRSPANGRIEETIYTAGPRGYRPRGPNIARKHDLSQVRRGPIGRPGDPFFDPNEDPSYEFGFKTPTYQRQESADRNAKVTGRYSYIDDVGERHDVQYTAGKDTGFHVGSLYPDSNPDSPEYRYFRGPLHKANKKTRGKASVQRGTDGSYRFISGGPDQRRTESKDPFGNVRGSYTFLDDKGKQHTTHYIAGPGIGYRVLKKSEEPHYPGFYPYRPFYPPLAGSTNIGGPGLSAGLGGIFPSPGAILPTDAAFSGGDDDDIKDFSTDDVFGAAASGHVKPTKFGNGNKNKDGEKTGGGNLFVGSTSSTAGTGLGEDDGDDIFGSDDVGSTSSTSGKRPGGGGSSGGGGSTGSGGSGGSSGSGTGGGIGGGTGGSGIGGGTGGGGIGGGSGTGGGIGGGSGIGGGKGPKRPTGDSDNTEGITQGSGSGGDLGGIGSTSSTSGSRKPSGAPTDGTTTGTEDEFNDGDVFGKPGATVSSGGSFPSPGGSKKPSTTSTASSQKPGRPMSFGDDDDDDLFGPSSNVHVGVQKPGSTASSGNGGASGEQEGDDDDDDLFGGLGGDKKDKTPSSRPPRPPTSTRPFSSTKPSGGGMNQYLPMPTDAVGTSLRPSTTSSTSFSTSTSTFPVTPTQSFGISAVPFPGQHIQHGTIFRNVGNSFIGFPPGVAVRAHVQSIDLFPIGSTNPSPGEAMEKGNHR